MNAVQSSLSSPRTSRIIFWLGAALVVAAVVVFIVKKSNDGGSSSAAPAAKAPASIPSADEFQKQMDSREPDIHTNKKWATVPASAKLAVRRFIVDGAGERNLARAWPYMHSDIRGGLTFKQFVHGNQLPFTPFEQMNLKIPMSITLTDWTGHDFLAEVGIASTDKVGRGAYVFNVGGTKVGTGAHARWLVNYWMPLYTPPVRADPSQNFGG
jgi:hypothetical protein